MSVNEVYKLDCTCGHTIEIPAGNPAQAESLECPYCEAALIIEWRPEAA